MHTWAVKCSSQFEEGQDKAAELEKQVKEIKSEKQAVKDVSYCLVELSVLSVCVCLQYCVSLYC